MHALGQIAEQMIDLLLEVFFDSTAAEPPVRFFVRSAVRLGPSFKRDCALPASQDLERARNLLVRYFKLLHDGYYDEAVKLDADDYDVLAIWNPDVPADHYGQLFAAACETQLRCLEVRRVVRSKAVSASQFEFVVEFSNENGTLFKLGPCCRATEKEMPTTTQFAYSVEQRGGEMRVHGLPIYVL